MQSAASCSLGSKRTLAVRRAKVGLADEAAVQASRYSDRLASFVTRIRTAASRPRKRTVTYSSALVHLNGND